MGDFRLKVFISVARNLSFTKAARELFISQPAITKHIQELESTYKVALFERHGGVIRLTRAGEIMLERAETIIESYNRLKIEMNLLSDNLSGELRIGASTTIAQYLLPTIAAMFITRFPEVKITLASGNSTQIEDSLFARQIDLGMVEGSVRRQGLRYIHFTDDRLELVTSVGNTLVRSAEISAEELKNIPLVLRESGSGTLEVIERTLAAHKIKISDLHTIIQLDSTESIKLFLRNSDASAILPVISVKEELATGTLRIVGITDVNFVREFAFVVGHGDGNKLAEQFMRFAEHYRYI